MSREDVVVVGGSVAGLVAAKTCRRHYPDKRVLLLRKEEKVPIPCGIPYVFGTVDLQDNLIPDSTLEKDGIDFQIDKVVKIDRNAKAISTSGGEEIGYEKLILATGSNPSQPPIPGLEKENVYSVKKDVDYLRELLDSVQTAKKIVIIGGGFIGVEFADQCKKNRDIDLTIVELLPHCLTQGGFDEEFCKLSERKLRDNGIKLRTGERVEAILGDEKATQVQLDSGAKLETDLVLVAVGSRPNTELAEKAGLELQESGAIKVDKWMRTSDPDIFACGDCAGAKSFFTGKPTQVMLASVASNEARIAGSNLFDLRRENPGHLAIYSTKIANLSLASAGMSESKAKQNGYKVLVGRAKAPNRHPKSMPGMKETEVKLTFDKDKGTLLGGQISGGRSSGELINLIGACIQAEMTADEIAKLQVGTHPALTSSPIAYQITNAAESALEKMD